MMGVGSVSKDTDTTEFDPETIQRLSLAALKALESSFRAAGEMLDGTPITKETRMKQWRDLDARTRSHISAMAVAVAREAVARLGHDAALRIRLKALERTWQDDINDVGASLDGCEKAAVDRCLRDLRAAL